MRGVKRKSVLIVGAEAMPFAATGGLGDVIGSLPQALAAADRELDVRVVMPLYSAVGEKHRAKMKQIAVFDVNLSWRKQYCGIFSMKSRGVTYYFIDNEYYFRRDTLYGQYDDGERFAYFCSAVIEMMKQLNYEPDILHAHDWQAALSLMYLEREKRCGKFLGTKKIFTIHNIEYQGKYDFSILGDVFGLGAEDADILSFDGCINLMKGAIELADTVSTVSPTYSREILTPEYGKGLQNILAENSFKLCGILNGIDNVYYNPSSDSVIPAVYSADEPDGKAFCKAALRAEAGLSDGDVPLFAIISRLVAHKGLDLVCEAIRGILNETSGQLIVLGKGTPEMEDFFRGLEAEMPGRVRALIVYDRDLSKRIYAGADILLMPSRSEPCGLAQMIACAYGTIPVVRETGGLADSVSYAYRDGDGVLTGNGFTFAEPSASALYGAAKAASDFWYRPEDRKELIHRIMTTDFSWSVSALSYSDMYRSLLMRR